MESLTWPRQCAERIARGDTAFLLARPPRSSARILKAPTNAEFLRFIVRQGKRVLARVVQAGLYADDWNIGVAVIDRRRLIEGWRATEVDWAEPDPAGRQLPDPMVLEREGGATIFAEQFDYASPGRIIALDWPERFSAELAQVELQSASHVSYPFVFTRQDESWMIPETRSTKRLSLWRRDASGAWNEACRLAENVSLTDPTVVCHNERWWLFCCDGAGLPDTRLLIYFADDIFGPWRGHPLNPVKFDVRSARPAGPLSRWTGCSIAPRRTAPRPMAARSRSTASNP
jgi:hypothetical protein